MFGCVGRFTVQFSKKLIAFRQIFFMTISGGRCLLVIRIFLTGPENILSDLAKTLSAGKNISFLDAIINTGLLKSYSSFLVYSFGGRISIL